MAFQLAQQTLGVQGAFGRSQLKPVTRLLRFVDRGLGTQTTVFELGTTVTGPGSLAQQLMADAPITGIAAITAKHLPQTTLRHHDTTTRRLLEQTTGEMLNAGLLIQARVIQQP